MVKYINSIEELAEQKEIQKLVTEKIQENARLQELYDLYNGNNKYPVSKNYCSMITSFITNYVVGEIAYDGIDKDVEEQLIYNDTTSITQETVKLMNIYGYSGELFYIDEDGNNRTKPIDPKELIFLKSNNYDEPVVGVIRLYDNYDVEETQTLVIYTQDSIEEYQYKDGKLFDNVTLPNDFIDIPITLYQNVDTKSCFENVKTLQVALNDLLSWQHKETKLLTDGFLVMTKFQSQKERDFALSRDGDLRVIDIDDNTKIPPYFLTKTTDFASMQYQIGLIENSIRDVARYPHLSNDGSIADSGIALKVKLLETDIYAKEQTILLKKAVRRRLELFYGDDSYVDVKIDIVRSTIVQDIANEQDSFGALGQSEYRQYEKDTDVLEEEIEEEEIDTKDTKKEEKKKLFKKG